MKKIDRTGEVTNNRNGLEMKIIEYKNNKEVRVLFTASGETRKTTYLKFRRGQVYPTWKNMRHKDYIPSKDLHQDIRDVDISELVMEREEPSVAISVALFVGMVAIIFLLGWCISWIF